MSPAGVAALRALAETDPVVAPLARLQAEALQGDPDRWDSAIPSLAATELSKGTPLLHGVTLDVDRQLVVDLLDRLATTGVRHAPGAEHALREAAEALRGAPLEAIQASLQQDGPHLDEQARAAAIEPSLHATLAHLATLPLLQAAGRRAAPVLATIPWAAGFCPTCAAWPTLVELRGLERQRWLRCGRCGAGWFAHRHICVYCGNADHRTLGYLAAEVDRDARRAETCTRCRGYLKAVATLGALDPSEVLVRDAATLEFDVAALDQGFERPGTPGYPLQVHVRPTNTRLGWSLWKR